MAHRVQKPQKSKTQLATYKLSIQVKNNRNRWHFKYVIYPPEDRPFLPSDEALRTKIDRFLPRIRFVECLRLDDRDVLVVRGVEDNLFRTIAETEQRKLRRAFLLDLAESAFSERPHP